MAQSFLERLQAGETLVADGATGTNLQKVGLKAGMSPEVWVMEQPEKILALEKAFVEAGSDIILTCTFGGTRLRLKDSPYAERVAEVNQRAVEIARQATQARPEVLIGGSMGPVGGLLKPYGPLTLEEVGAAYLEQAQALTGAGVDLLVIETQFSLEEAKAALEAARQAGDLPVVVSFSYDRGTRTMMGVKPSQVVQTFQPLGVTAIGANCGTTLENMGTIVKEYAQTAAGLVIWAKPNAGMPVMGEDGLPVFNVTPEQMAEFAVRYLQAGARILGGCCGTTPAHLAAIAEITR
ncbi:MAG: homocysteine S-methyltransferase family protein [Anaerolineales bacterium]|nr:homocysteine S-methyltransferase family protein [Anaerolineales bacterium]